MELRSCTHLHFIQAVRGGLVIKIQNVNRGRPELKFKNLKDVYEADDSKNQTSFLLPKEEFEGFIFDRITIADPNDSEFSCSDDNGGSDSDLDDLGAGMMTLKQIIAECKAKKRKRSEVIDSRAEELCTKVKQETADDECDLMEPLITWKSKLSKKSKSKRSCMKGCVSTPSESALSVVKVGQESFPAPTNIKVEPDSLDSATAICFNGDSSLIYDIQGDSCQESQKPGEMPEMVMDCNWGTLALCSDGQNKIFSVGNSLIHENQVDSCGDSQNHREVTEIAAECDWGDQALCSDSQNPREVIEVTANCDQGTQALCSESQTPITAIGNSSLIDYNPMDSCGLVPKEVTETVSKCDQGIEAIISLSKGPQHFVSVTDCESMEHADSEPVEIVDSHEDSCGLTEITRKVTEIATEAVTGTNKLISLIEDPQCCIMNEACYEYAEHAFSEPLQVPSDSYDDIKEADIPEINNDQFSYLPVSESNGEGCVGQTLSADTIPPVSDGSSDLHDDCPSPSTSEEIPGNIDSKEVQIPDVAIHGCLQYTESSHGSNAHAPDGNAKDDLFSNLETSALHSPDGKYSSDPEYWFTPLAHSSPTTGEKQSWKSSIADAERNFFPDMLGQDACEDFTTSDDADYYSKLGCPPQRLLSTRKAISPDSQEILCKAMESIELQEEEQYRPRKELSFGHQTGKETKINAAERPAKIIRVRSSADQKQNIVKSKNEKRQDQSEGVQKDTNLSQSVPRFSTGCNSIEICSQSAIAFTQRQMQDIECLATKLTNELKTMKEIAEDRLYSQASPATSLKYKANEVRMAVKNATKVEQLANRWLSMMSRDCNRFCTIMRLAEKDSDAPESESVINKERKKITFADEAGEELCQIRFIENKLTSSLEPGTEKPEVLN